jgi:hypothetical protein
MANIFGVIFQERFEDIKVNINSHNSEKDNIMTKRKKDKRKHHYIESKRLGNMNLDKRLGNMNLDKRLGNMNLDAKTVVNSGVLEDISCHKSADKL